MAYSVPGGCPNASDQRSTVKRLLGELEDSRQERTTVTTNSRVGATYAQGPGGHVCFYSKETYCRSNTATSRHVLFKGVNSMKIEYGPVLVPRAIQKVLSVQLEVHVKRN